MPFLLCNRDQMGYKTKSLIYLFLRIIVVLTAIGTKGKHEIISYTDGLQAYLAYSPSSHSISVVVEVKWVFMSG